MNPLLSNSYLLVVAGFNLVLGFIVWSRSSRSYSGISFFAIAICVAAWTIGLFCFNSLKNLVVLSISERALTAISVLIPYAFSHFVFSFKSTFSAYPRIHTAFHVGVILFFVLLLPTSYMVTSVSAHPWGGMFKIGPVYPFYMAYFIGFMGKGVFDLYQQFQSARGMEKLRIQYLLFAVTIAILIGSFVNILLPVFGIGQLAKYGPLGTVVMGFLMAYAIVKHQLMDINIIVRKTIIYAIVTGFVTALLILIAILSARAGSYVLGDKMPNQWITACFLAAVFHPILLQIHAVIEKSLFKSWADKPIAREIAAGFSHELKSPLAGLAVRAELTLAELDQLEKGEKLPREAIPKIKSELSYILNQALDAARRIEAVRGVAEAPQVAADSVDLRGVVNRSLEALQAKLQKSGIDVRQEWPETLPEVAGSAGQLEIVFINLIKNAADAMESTPASERQLTLRAAVRSGSVEIALRDSGPGIAAKDLPNIFDPYFTTKGTRGMGMGLYLAHQIIKAHGGTLEVASASPTGAEFTLRLPINQ